MTKSTHRRKTSSKRFLRAAVMATPAVAAALMSASSARAAALYWDTNGATAGSSGGTTATGTWDSATTANWTTDATGAIATTNWVSGSTATFSAGTNATAAYTVTIAPGDTIAGVDGITFEEATVTIAAGDAGSGLTLTGATITNTSAGVINALVGGTVGVNKIGAAALTLGNAANTFTGGVTVAEGNLNVASDGALGDAANSVTLGAASTAGTLTATTGFTTARGISLAGAGTLSAAASQNLVVNGVISGAGALTKAGAGTVTLNGANTNSGGTTISAGTLVVGNTGALGGAVTVGAGTLSITPGTADALTLSALTLNANSRTSFDLGAPGVGDLVNAGALTIGGSTGINIADLGSFGAGTYTLIDYAGTLTGAVNSFFVNSNTSAGTFGYKFENDATNGLVNLVVSAITTSAAGTWNVDADGIWDDSANWQGGNVPSGIDAVANFGNVITADRTVSLTSSRTVGTLNFNDNNQYILAGPAALTMQTSAGSAAINVQQFNATIAAPMVLASATTADVAAGSNLFITGIVSGTNALTKTGAGQLVYTVRPTNTGGTVIVNAGSVRGNIAALPNAITVNAGGTAYLRDSAAGTYSGVLSGAGTFITEFNAAGSNPIFTLNANSPMTGTVRFTGGNTVALAGANGRFPSASAMHVDRATTLQLNNGTNQNDRIGGSTALHLNGATLTLTGHATAVTNEVTGPLHLGTGGTNWINMAPGAAAFNFTAASLNRAAGATALFRGTAIGTNTLANFKFTTAPTLAGNGGAAGTPDYGIVPGLFIDVLDIASAGTRMTLATYDATNGVRKLATSEYTSAVASGNATAVNFAPAAASTLTVAANTLVNLIEYGGASDDAATAGATININASRTLTLQSGTIFYQATNASTIGGSGTLAFGTGGTGEAIINVHANAASSNGNSLRINAAMSGSSLTKEGNNDLILGGTNNFTGVTHVNRGRLIVTQNNQLGSGVIVGNSGLAPNFGAAYNFGGALQLTNNVSYNIPLTMGGGTTSTGNSTALGALDSGSGSNTWNGNITITGQGVNSGDRLLNTVSAQTNATLVMNGLISSQFMTTGNDNTGLVFSGEGTKVMGGATPNTYDGLSRIFGGLVIAEKNAAFGTSRANDVADNVIFLAATTAAVGFRNNVNYTEPEWIFTASGTPANGQIQSLGGNNTFAGFISWGAPVLVDGFRPGTLNVTSGSFDLSGMMTSTGTEPRNITKTGAGDLIFSGNNNNQAAIDLQGFQSEPLLGRLTIAQGNVILRSSDPAKGNLPAGVTSVVVNQGTSLVLDNSLAVNTNRVSNTTAVELAGYGAELKLIGNAAAPVTQAMTGGLNVSSFSTITVDENGQDTELALNTIARVSRGTALLRGMDNINSFIDLSDATADLKGGGGGPGTATISILPYVVGDTAANGVGTDFVTINASGYARPLSDAAGEYVALSNGNATLVNSKVQSSIGLSSDTTVNSVKLFGGNTVTIDPGRKLFVRSGGVLGVGAGTSVITGGTLTFEDATITTNPDTGETEITVNSAEEGIITVPTASSMTINSVLAGAPGITKSGDGVLTLTGTNTYGQGSGGKTTINAGVLEITADANLGNANANVTLNGGTLRPLVSSSTARTIELGSLGVNAIDVGPGATYVANGMITGRGLTKKGEGRLDLTNPSNNYTGGTVIEGGEMGLDPALAAAQPQFGTGTITLAGGSVRADASMTLDKGLIVTNGINTTGGIFVAPGQTLTFGAGATSTIGITGSGNLAVKGGGTLLLAKIAGAGMTYNGTFYVQGGSTLRYEDNDAATPNINAGIGNATTSGVQWDLSGGSTLVFDLPSAPAAISGGSFTGLSRGIRLGTGGGTVNVNVNGAFITQGKLSGSGVFIKDGPSELSLRSQDTLGNNEFSGPIVIKQGTLTGSNQNFALDADNLEIMLGTGTDASTGTSFLKIHGAGGLVPLVNSINMTLNAGRSIELMDGTPHIGVAAAGVLTVNGVIKSNAAHTGGLRIDNRGGGTAGWVTSTVLGGQSTYLGDTIIKSIAVPTTAGTQYLRMGAANALPSTTTVRFDPQLAGVTTVLDLATNGTTAGHDQTVAAVVNDGTVGTARITNSGNGTPATLTVVGGITGGTMQIGQAATGVNVHAKHVRNSSLDVQGTSTVKVAADVTADGVSNIGTLTIAPDAKLDLNNTKLVTNSPVGSFNGVAYTGIQGEVQRAYNFGAWDLPGLTTSQPNAGQNAGILSGTETIAVATAEQVMFIGATDTGVFQGQTVTGATTIAMYTYAGDLNLDGLVDGADYGVIDNSVQFPGTDGYVNGDFNYDGVIDGADYGVIDNTIQLQGAPFPGVVFGAPELAASSASGGGLSGVTAVPEPAGLSVVALAAMGVLGRRRRK